MSRRLADRQHVDLTSLGLAANSQGVTHSRAYAVSRGAIQAGPAEAPLTAQTLAPEHAK